MRCEGQQASWQDFGKVYALSLTGMVIMIIHAVAPHHSTRQQHSFRSIISIWNYPDYQSPALAMKS